MSQPASILIVEDDGILSLYLEELLCRQGYAPLPPVSTGEAAVRAAQASQPALVLMDIELAGEMTGLEAAEKLAQVADVPIIYISSYSQDSLIQEARLTAPYGYLVKPVSERELIATIEMALHRHPLDRQVRLSEARYHALVEQAADAIFLTSPDGMLLEVNTAGCALLGRPRQDLLEHSLGDYLSPARGAERLFPRPAQAGNGVLRSEYRVEKPGGQRCPVEISARQLAGGEFQVIARDISERAQVQQLNLQNEDRLRALQAILHYDASSSKDLLDYALQISLQLTQSSMGYIITCDEAGKELTLVSWTGGIEQTCTIFEPNTKFQLDQTGLWGEVVRQRRPVLINDYAAPHPLKRGLPEGHVRLTRFLSVPVFSQKQIVAVVGVANKGCEYDETDILQLSLLMESIWKIFERRQVEDTLRVQTHALEAAANVIVITDRQGMVQWANPAFTDLTGYSLGEAAGRSTGELLRSGVHPPEFYGEMWDTILAGQVWRGELVNRRKDNSRYDEEMTITPLRSPAGEISQFIAIKQDITPRKQAEAAQRQLEDKFRKAFHTSPDAININRLSDGVYLEVNEGFLALTGYTRDEVIGRSSLDLQIWVNPEDRQRLVEGLRSQGEVWNLEAPFRGKFGQVHVCLMSARIIEDNGEMCILSITRDISQRKHAEEQLRRSAEELSAAYEATLRGWSNALELRERETAGHSRRVVQLTLRLAEAFGLQGMELDHVRRGALLHDIGKMAIPDSILLKPGPLTPDEWVIMKQHPIYAYQMLNPVTYLRPAMDIPCTHHERWDGTGYPFRLAGEDIPLAARLFAVVDVWDALLSDRPYRPAWPPGDAVRHLKEQAGKHFDPRVVETFLSLLDADLIG